MATPHCPLCYAIVTGRETDDGYMDIFQTDKYIRALGDALAWDDYAVCSACYGTLRTYHDIVLADRLPKEVSSAVLPDPTQLAKN